MEDDMNDEGPGIDEIQEIEIEIDEADETNEVEVDEVEELDPDGDVILNISENGLRKRFRVSSKVLGLASTVFKTLFGRKFYEGTRLAESGYTRITLHEDSPIAMGMMLAVLHFKDATEQIHAANNEQLVELGACCDKYDCIASVRPWVLNRLSSIPCPKSNLDCGYILAATNLFRSQEHFSKVSIEAIQRLLDGWRAEWDQCWVIDFLPETLLEDLTKKRRELQAQMHREMQSVELSLRISQKYYSAHGMVCPSCERTHPHTAKICHPCRNTALLPKTCNSDTRVGEYFTALRKAQLWPSIDCFEICTPLELANRAYRANMDLKHRCEASDLCPLVEELNKLDKKYQEILEKIEGLSLYPLH